MQLRFIILLLFMGSFLMKADEQGKLPIIFSEEYDITLMGVEKLHPFDGAKYGKVYRYLAKELGIDKDKFYTPGIATDKMLLSVHSQAYLNSLNESEQIAKIAELHLLSFIPNSILQKSFLKPMKYATAGTLLGGELALKNGWAINLSGGYHHAKAISGEGFCFFADIPIAVHNLFKSNDSLSAMIIDLDAHQGNGFESIFKDDPRIHIFDVYNEDIYPNDVDAKQYIEFDFPVKSFIEDKAYLELLTEKIPLAIAKSKPDIIIYNAGTDIFEGDRLGQMDISEAGIIKRDEIVFQNALENNIPILMVLSGGYTKKSAEIISRSIENLLKNVIIKETSLNQSDLFKVK